MSISENHEKHALVHHHLHYYYPQDNYLRGQLSHLYQKRTIDNNFMRSYSTRSNSKLTHTNEEGNATMVDVSDKEITFRCATAKAIVIVGEKIAKLIKENNLKKGDVFTVSQLAGITGAKKTSELIPLCHNIPITNINVAISLDDDTNAVIILATVKCEGKTGVEMEALTAASVSALTVYDMCKSISHDILIKEIQLMSKSGGRSGDYNKDSFPVRPYETTPLENESVYVGTV